MPCNHIMLDLETLSTRKDAAIIQLAALAFDPLTGELGPRFNAFIRDPSGHIDVQTVAWWMKQAQAARIGAAVACPRGSADSDVNPTMDEFAALGAFAGWVRQFGNGFLGTAGFDASIEALWSRGATFDIVVLQNAYARDGRGKPWSYRVERDTRTLYALAPGGMPKVGLDPGRVHDAAYDCEVQVEQVVGALRALREQSDHAALYLGRVGDLSGERAERAEVFVEPTAPTQRAERLPEWSRAEGFTAPGEYTVTGHPIYSHDGD